MVKLKGHIVKILDEYSLIINIGSNRGLYNGCKVEVIGKSFNMIIDPISGDDLGPIYSIKSNLIVTKVFEKMSICMGELEFAPDSGIHKIHTTIDTFFKTEKKMLNIDYNCIEDTDTLQNQTIKIGDKVYAYLNHPEENID